MKLPQTTLRDLFWLILVVAIVLVWRLDRKEAPAPPPPAANGRYTVTVSGNEDSYRAILCDTTTGQCWTRKSSSITWMRWYPHDKTNQ